MTKKEEWYDKCWKKSEEKTKDGGDAESIFLELALNSPDISTLSDSLAEAKRYYYRRLLSYYCE